MNGTTELNCQKADGIALQKIPVYFNHNEITHVLDAPVPIAKLHSLPEIKKVNYPKLNDPLMPKKNPLTKKRKNNIRILDITSNHQ
jgi:hypothetical protein